MTPFTRAVLPAALERARHAVGRAAWAGASELLARIAPAELEAGDLELDFEPDTMIDAAEDMLGTVRRRAAADLERFREFIESRRRENGSWRGGINHNP